MKTILFVLALTCSQMSFAQAVWVRPSIFNFGSSIQVQINNTEKFDINCSGTIQTHLQRGSSHTFFYNDYIRSRSFSSRSFMLPSVMDRITTTFDFITCYKAP